MASDEKLVITAIRDMSQEGFIAASLARSGWKVIYRATSLMALREKVIEFPEALLLASDDFGDLSGMNKERCIELRGRSHPLTTSSSLDPQNDFELAEIIRSREAHAPTQHISATSADVIAISSIGGRTGATTIAITIAEQISRLGKSVLLVEGNRIHPTIAYHFQIHNIRGEIAQSQYGFSICEATNLQSLSVLAQEANHYDCIVVDMGPACLAINGGQRVEDLLQSWTEHSRARFLISARDDERSSSEVIRYLDREQSSQLSPKAIFLTASKIHSGRERKKFIEEARRQFGCPVEIMSRDIRSVEKMEKSHSTLYVSAPQSPIAGEIARYLERERYS
jgi:Mrp family chromosome partitioning ATPase